METADLTQYAVGDNPCTIGPSSVKKLGLLLDKHPQFTGSIASATVSVVNPDGTAATKITVGSPSNTTNQVNATYTTSGATVGTYYTAKYRVTLANGEVISVERDLLVSKGG